MKLQKLVESNKNVMIVYCFITFIFLCLSLLGLLHKGFEYYALVVTAISFSIGGLHLLSMLHGIKVEGNSTPEHPQLWKMFLENFSRFMLVALAIVLSFLFIKFAPIRAGYTFSKYLYLYALINILPSPICIILFYMRSKYVG